MGKVFVKDSTAELKKVLLCPPEHIAIEPIDYISKQWVAQGAPIDREACRREHGELVQAYRDNGVEVVLAEPDRDLKNQVYARDFGACLREGYILGRFREPVRQGETERYAAEMEKLGIPCIARCDAGYFEGGDFWFIDDYTIAVGLVQRTDQIGFLRLEAQLQALGYQLLPVPCPPDNLHLDMCFNLAAEKVAVLCKEALPDYFLRFLTKKGFTFIEVRQEDVFRHHCNIQALGKGRVLSFSNNKTVNQRLAALGLDVIAIDLYEILKSGGGPHCMTFPLKRE